LENLDCYHEEYFDEERTDQLMKGKPVGSYLLRRNRKDSGYILSVK